MQRSIMKVLAAILIVFVFSGFYFLLAPYAGETAEENPPAGMRTDALQQSDADAVAGTGEDRNRSSEYLILVNKTHGLKKNYRPEDLKHTAPAAQDRPKEYQKLRKTAAKAFRRLSKAAGKKGHSIKLTTGFRPYDYQKTLYKQYIQADGKKKAEQYSAKPGYSEHQTGLSADVSSPSVDYQLTRKYGKTKEGKWLARNAHKYGFIIRYPKDREHITGYEYEPWHIRYVGVEAAKEIYRQNITLEEYLGDI